jgi:hypothetical protein
MSACGCAERGNLGGSRARRAEGPLLTWALTNLSHPTGKVPGQRPVPYHDGLWADIPFRESLRWHVQWDNRGIPYECIGRADDVPGVPRAWLDGIVYIYPSEAEARAGGPVGATGFLMSLDPSPGLPASVGHLYIVTNAHVFERGGRWVRFNLHEGGTDVQEIRTDGWFPHPDGDDLVLAPWGDTKGALKTSHVSFGMAATPDLFEEHQQLGPGDEAFFIGRFIHRDGKTENTPTARFGAIAQVGGDPIVQRDRNGFKQESILVECHSLSGFSGSPVFAYRSANIRSGQQITEMLGRDDDTDLWVAPQYARVYLLGVDWGSDPWMEDVRDKRTDSPVNNEYVRAPSGMAHVVPAWSLRGALDHPGLVELRGLREEYWRTVLDD